MTVSIDHSDDVPSKTHATLADPPARAEEPTVVCFVSGRTVLEREAVLVPLGPGHKVWMLPEFCRS